MFRRLVLLWVFVSTLMAGGVALAQMPFPVDIIPTRTALERLGLERQWYAVIPLNATERLMKITLSGDLIFAQTDYAFLHAFDAETGRYLWSAQLGERTGFARGVASNSYAVFATNANIMFALDKKTGRPIWRHNLGTIPTSSPACDETLAMVGMTSGRIFTFGLKRKDEKGNESVLSIPDELWNWHTGGPVLTRPLPAEQFAVFGSSDGKISVVEAKDGNSLFRLPTGGPIGEGLGTYGTRMLLVPSGDNNLYGADILGAVVKWSFASGAPINQEPLVADQDAYIVNTAGNFTALDPNTGDVRWTRPTQGGRLAAISANKLYLRSYNLDLFVMDRKTGRMLIDPGETFIRAGLKLREYDLDVVNRFHDRIYFATSSGMVVCLREIGQPNPRLLKDPKARPFGYVPPEGLKETPPTPPGADPASILKDDAVPRAAGRRRQAEGAGCRARITNSFPFACGDSEARAAAIAFQRPRRSRLHERFPPIRRLQWIAAMSEPTNIAVKRALFSVFDKRGLVELARALAASGAQLLASGGTRSALVAAGLDVTEVSDYTGQPEVFGGRVKTLHPKIHGGILARRNDRDDMATLDELGFAPIDLVVVNLYPFAETVARSGVTEAEAIENIDIGGPALIRAAAKNYAHVAVLTSPEQYDDLITALRETGGTGLEDRRRLALAAFETTSAYDAAIRDYFRTDRSALAGEHGAVPSRRDFKLVLRYPLRYGENPHQEAAFYVEPERTGINLASAELRHGKELSFNNLLDLDSALRLVRQFAQPAACILKHNNPCGAAVAADLATAFVRAYEGDPLSAFGGIVGLNRPLDLATAEQMCQPGRFLEAVLAPGFDDDALDWIRTKPTWRHSVRLVDLGAPISPAGPGPSGMDFRRIEGGVLVQSWDQIEHDPSSGTIATRRAPTEPEKRDLAFAWVVCAQVKSNAIVLAKDGQVVGVGAGQMSRLDSVRIAVEKAGPRAQNSVMASDAFFPFRDGPEVAAAAGVTAIIQPGGSKRDDDTVRACDEHNIAMILTGRRHFRH